MNTTERTETETWAVYVSTDSNSAPVAVAGTEDAALRFADAFNYVANEELFYVDHVLNRGKVSRIGYYRDADNVTMVRDIIPPEV